MKAKKIFIASGAIHSGKSTTLINWAKNRNDVYGILTPKIGEKRVFMDAKTKEIFQMEADADDGAPMLIGKYRFSFPAFAKAIATISENSNHAHGWLVIDEIGPLEIEGKGFDEILTELLAGDNFNMNLILVVRDNLLKEVINHYNLAYHDFKIFNPEMVYG